GGDSGTAGPRIRAVTSIEDDASLIGSAHERLKLCEGRFSIQLRVQRIGRVALELPLGLCQRGAQCIEPSPRARRLPLIPVACNARQLTLRADTDDESDDQEH